MVSSNLRLNNQANAWLAATSSTTDSGAVPVEIERYATARTKIIGALQRQFDLASGGSIDEVNLARRGVVGLLSRDLLTEYVAAYRDLLRGINSAGINDSWRWHAWCLDSVLLFRADASGPTAHLLGPYHPITLVRLFYLQLCLGERLIEDQYSPLAQIFAQAQPLALGHVLDAKLQPAHAIGFPTGEPHWLWLYRQQGQSNLPEEELVEWLRRTGLDPEAGPWGVDAEVLPQTLNQYILA